MRRNLLLTIFYRDLGVNPFFASEVGGERRDQLSKAGHPPLGGGVLARRALLWEPSLDFFQVPHRPEEGCS